MISSLGVSISDLDVGDFDLLDEIAAAGLETSMFEGTLL